ncbi:MAG: phenylalanine--tRNA ligase subunit beta, partial [Candidatus Izimaplasma sp.]|nr:phenylalanine--tRNA ligase subunit beta [Candidatus Izimaplasma bacterium]
MKVSLNWLKELVDINVSVKELADKFNIHSAEVEEFYDLAPATNLVVGYVVEKAAHPNADKLSVCQVDIGGVVSQIVCGAPNVEAGQKVIVSVPGSVLPGNYKIKKSTIRDVESNGMICSLNELGIDKKYHNEDGIHVLPNSAEVGKDAIEEMFLNDEVMVLDLTPNRADLLSMMGLAYDTAAILDTKIHLNIPNVEEIEEENPVKIKIETDNCSSYYARIIKDIKIMESPLYMQARLIAAGVRPINNVVDITNYVMLETGQPLHAFDYDLLGSDTITVRMARAGELFTTLDEKERSLTENDILITNNKTGVALGGVMGGFDTEIINTSKTILLESAVFDPYHIRKTSARLDLRSEASNRFERKVDPARTILALNMASELFAKYANGKVLKGVSKVDNTNKQEIKINLSLEKINHYLGSDYSLELVKETLTKLAFSYELKNTLFTISAPTRRQDIGTYQDIIEEVGRIIGYDKLPLTLPTTISIGKLSDYQAFRRKLKKTMTGLGLDEAISYSLLNEDKVFDFVNGDAKIVKVAMPMSKDRAVMTLTPLNGLLDAIKYNLARKNKDVFLYEIGKRYEEGNERLLLAGALTGELSNIAWQGQKEIVDFYIVKGLLESLFTKIGLSHLDFTPMGDYKNLHPGQSAYIKDRTGTVGFIGKLHPKYENNNDLKDVFIFELDVLKMYEVRRPLKKVKEINKFPSIYRDLAIVVDKTVAAKELIDAIKKAGKRMLVNVNVFDLYVGESLGHNKKSLAIRMEFSDTTKTLESNDVDARVKEILGIIGKQLEAVL